MTGSAVRLTAESYWSLLLNWRALPRVAVEPILCAFVLLIITLAFEALLGIEETMPAEAVRHVLGIATTFELMKSVVIWLAVAPVFSHWSRHLLGRGSTTWSKLGLSTWSVLPAWMLSGLLLLLAAIIVSAARHFVAGLEGRSVSAELLPAEPGPLSAVLMIWCLLSARLFVVMALRATMTPGAWRAAGHALRGRRLKLVVTLWLTVVPVLLLFTAAKVTGGDLTEIVGATLLALLAGTVAANFIRHRDPAPTRTG